MSLRSAMFALSAVLMFGAAAAPAPSAEPLPRASLETQLEAMKKMDGFLGEWLGDGWLRWARSASASCNR